LLSAVALLAMAATGAAVAGQQWRLGHVIAGGTPIDVAAHRFAELIKVRSKGEIEISVQPAGQLGGERAIIEAVQLGTVAMSLTTTGAIGSFAPEFQVLDLPYLFPTDEAAYTFLDGANGRKLLGLLDRRGMHGLTYFENGWRNFTSSRGPLRRPEDIEGQTIRVMESPMYMGLVRSLGARPAPIPYDQLPRALAKGQIDGQENPAVNVYSARMYESQAFMIRDRHTYNVFILKINGKLWRSLPAHLRTVIETTAAEVRDFQRKLNREADQHFIAKLVGRGVRVHEPTTEELQAWQAATASLYADAPKIVGPNWVSEATQFRKDWDAGLYASEAQRYIEAYEKITVPVDTVMRNFR
jgi:tripartite ATP-independent transporter DctP family solute receptor